MPDHKFVYRGRELEPPLMALVALLKEKEKKAKDELVGFDKSSLPKTIIAIDPATQHYLHLESKFKEVSSDLKRAEDWLREVRRTPRFKWTLDFIDLNWLYRRT